MNPKPDQLRKRYANPSAQPDASGAYALGPRSITADHAEEQPTIGDTNTDTHSPFGQGPAPIAGIAEHNRKDGSPAIEERHPTDIARDVEALFEPARNYRDHVALSFEAIRALRSELNVLAQSAESLKGLQDSDHRNLRFHQSAAWRPRDVSRGNESAAAATVGASSNTRCRDRTRGPSSRAVENAGWSLPAKTAKDEKEASEKTKSE